MTTRTSRALPKEGEVWALTKYPGYTDDPWFSVAKISRFSVSDNGQAEAEYWDHFYAQGVQGQHTQGLLLPSDGTALHVWEADRERLVSFAPLMWEFVQERILPRLIGARGKPTSLKEFLKRL